MKSVRAYYDRLPIDVRVQIRSLLPKDLLRWYAHRKTDVYLISYPKCGRTWLRLMIGRAISLHYSLPESQDILLLQWKEKAPPDIPKITVVHEDHPMLKTPEELQKSKVKYRDKRVIFLVRDPRDVIVSSYFEMKNRGKLFGRNPYESRTATFEGSLAEFIDNRVGGFDTILAYYNIWAENRGVPEAFLLVRYEDMKANPKNELGRVIDFLGLSDILDNYIEDAVEYASFDNMRSMETKGKFSSGILQPAERSNTDTYKTRRGEVKGYVDYLSESEIQMLNRKMEERLSSYFNYHP